jgi:hypothetical protein
VHQFNREFKVRKVNGFLRGLHAIGAAQSPVAVPAVRELKRAHIRESFQKGGESA